MFDIIKSISIFKRFFNRKDLLLILFIIFSYFLTRLIYLDQFPIFSDEGIYIHWAKVAWHDATWRFISLTDGRQPLQTWATIPFLKLFPNNLLLAGRLFAVSSGFIALIGVFTLSFYLFGKKAAFFAAFFYIFTPYFIFYDRIALIDSTVNAAFIWILFFSILLIKTQRLDTALIFGLLGGMSLLAKSSVRIFLFLSALAPILVFVKNFKKNVPKFLNFYFLFSVVIFISVIIYNVQRLSPFFHFVAEKNKTFVMTFAEFLQNPFQYFFHNIRFAPLYVFWESGFFLAFLGILGLFLLFKKDKKLFYYLLLWILLPFIVISFFMKVLYPRYLIFFAGLFLILASYFVASQKNKKVIISIISVFILSVAYFDYTIIFAYKSIPFPSVDRGQYLEAWPAGWGIREIVEYARSKSQEKPVILLAEGNFGMSGDVLDIFLKRDDKISIKGYWPLDEKALLENQKELKGSFVYIVFSHRSEFPQSWPIKLVTKFDKPGGRSSIFLYELTK